MNWRIITGACLLIIGFGAGYGIGTWQGTGLANDALGAASEWCRLYIQAARGLEVEGYPSITKEDCQWQRTTPTTSPR